jgi:ribonuclease inhibitor
MPLKKTVTLDGRVLHSADDFYNELSRQLSLPGHFGRNLDALWDALSTDVEGPFEILWQHSGLSKNRLGKDFDSFIILLRDLEAEREDFRLFLEP